MVILINVDNLLVKNVEISYLFYIIVVLFKNIFNCYYFRYYFEDINGYGGFLCTVVLYVNRESLKVIFLK